MSDELARIRETKRKLSQVSPSFCLAKWLQVTVHLQNGHTHSCHHPDTHSVPMKELSDNPSALHNTSKKMKLRQAMLQGTRPEECDYCWKIEDTSADLISDRHIKSNDDWASPFFDEVKALPWDYAINPTYMEVSFSNRCNFKCAYCAPHVSSQWMDEIQKFGPYPTLGRYQNLDKIIRTGKMPIPENQPNPFVDAFWKWWPELYQNLKVFRITGGEPLLNKNTFKILDYIKDHPRPELELAINSNLGLPEKLITRLIDKLSPITDSTHLKQCSIFTSIDTWGKQAEYIRHGLKHDQFWKNVERLLDAAKDEARNVQLIFMCTFNALSITQFKPLLEKILELKSKYKIFFDISFLRSPEHLSVKILTSDFNIQVKKLLEFMESKTVSSDRKIGFREFETNKLNRVYQWMLRPEDLKWQTRSRSDFYHFIIEHDRRRKTNFLASFPEMTNFFELCKKDTLYSEFMDRLIEKKRLYGFQPQPE